MSSQDEMMRLVQVEAFLMGLVAGKTVQEARSAWEAWRDGEDASGWDRLSPEGQEAVLLFRRAQVIAERSAASFADFLAHGPRFWRYRETYVLARGDGVVLVGGVGIFGIGRTWTAEQPYRSDASYYGAPYTPEVRDDFGDQGYGR